MIIARPAAPFTNTPERCVIVINNELPAGRAGNAAAVLSLTVGQRHPTLVGAPLVDAHGVAMPGLIPIGISVLSASPQELQHVANAGASAGMDVVRFPVEGQQTKNYTELLDAIKQVSMPDMQYVGIALMGEKKAISKLVGKLALLGQEAA